MVLALAKGMPARLNFSRGLVGVGDGRTSSDRYVPTTNRLVYIRKRVLLTLLCREMEGLDCSVISGLFITYKYKNQVEGSDRESVSLTKPANFTLFDDFVPCLDDIVNIITLRVYHFRLLFT